MPAPGAGADDYTQLAGAQKFRPTMRNGYAKSLCEPAGVDDYAKARFAQDCADDYAKAPGAQKLFHMKHLGAGYTKWLYDMTIRHDYATAWHCKVFYSQGVKRLTDRLPQIVYTVYIS